LQSLASIDFYLGASSQNSDRAVHGFRLGSYFAATLVFTRPFPSLAQLGEECRKVIWNTI